MIDSLLNNANVVSLIAASLAFVAAAVSAVISFLAISASGKQKIAEYRKEWNADLREDIAQFTAEAVMSINKEHDQKNLIYRSFRIDISLDPSKERHRMLIEEKNELVELALKKNNTEHLNKMAESAVRFRTLATKLLNDEWDRLRKETKTKI